MKKIIVILIGITLATTLFAGLREWTCEGPYGADVYCIAVHPKNPDILYAGTKNGIYKSTDAGESWKMVRNTGSKFLTIDPNNPEVVYAEENKPIYDEPVIDIGYTENGGKTWKSCEVATMTEGRETCVAIDPRDSKIIYVGTQENGIYKTTDGGKNWQKIRRTGTNFLTIHPKNPDIIYAEPDVHIHDQLPDIDIGYSLDAGKNWDFTPLTDTVGMSGKITCVDIDPSTGEIYIGANYDSAEKYSYYIWRANAEITEMQKLLITPYHQGWYKTSSILVIRHEHMPSPSVYVTAYYNYNDSPKIYQSEDGGNNWTVNAFDDKCEKINQIVMGKDSTLYAATNVKYFLSRAGDRRYDNTGGVFKSTNLGKNWQRKVKGISDYKIESILFYDGKALPLLPPSTQHQLRVVEDPNEEGAFYAAVFHVTCKGLHQYIKKGRCSSNGIVWEEGSLYYNYKSGFAVFTALAISPDGKTLIAATENKIITGIKNETGKWTWTEQTTNLNINSILICDQGVFLGTNDGVYHTTGGAWVKIGCDGLRVNCLLYLPMSCTSCGIFAGTQRGIYLKEGENFRKYGLRFKDITAMIGRPGGWAGGGFIEYAATTEGVWSWADETRDGWYTYSPINTGLIDLNIHCLIRDDKGTFFDTRDDILYVGTNSGMFSYNNISSGGIDEEIISKDNSQIFRNHPNPFNPESWFPYTIKILNKKDAKIRIYNILGQKLEELDLRKGIASGIYFYELVVGKKVLGMKKSLVLK
jgi:photosystem II stability/assembly factor-like uncharacterized protein